MGGCEVDMLSAEYCYRVRRSGDRELPWEIYDYIVEEARGRNAVIARCKTKDWAERFVHGLECMERT